MSLTTGIPYAGAIARMYMAPAIPPAIEASWFLLSTPFPAKYAAPPWDICRMIGALASRAASRDATTVEEDVTLMAGMANLCSWA